MRQVSSKAKRNGRVVNYNVMTPNGVMALGTMDSEEFFDGIDTFYVEYLYDKQMGFSVRKEMRSGKEHWYAYKRVGGVLKKSYVGQSVTFSTLWDAAVAMLIGGTMDYGLINKDRKKPR